MRMISRCPSLAVCPGSFDRITMLKADDIVIFALLRKLAVPWSAPEEVTAGAVRLTG